MPNRVDNQPHRRDEPAAYSRMWREKNRERNNQYSRDYYAKRKAEAGFRVMKNRSASFAKRKAKYGVTRDQYEAMLVTQAGNCAICGVNKGSDLRIDHNHQTGAVRGLLCDSCNNGLGRFKDNPFILQAAIKYLQAQKG